MWVVEVRTSLFPFLYKGVFPDYEPLHRTRFFYFFYPKSHKLRSEHQFVFFASCLQRGGFSSREWQSDSSTMSDVLEAVIVIFNQYCLLKNREGGVDLDWRLTPAFMSCIPKYWLILGTYGWQFCFKCPVSCHFSNQGRDHFPLPTLYVRPTEVVWDKSLKYLIQFADIALLLTTWHFF